jgi:hypothetical protein
MEIKVAYDEELLRRYYERDKWVFFRIYCAHEGEAFPSDKWLDFGLVLLADWLHSTYHLLRGSADERFPFFDGPFWFRVHRQGNTLKVHLCESFADGDECFGEWLLPLDDFVREIVRAAKQVRSDLLRMGMSRGLNKYYLDQVQSSCPRIEELLENRQQMNDRSPDRNRKLKERRQK